MRIQGLTAYFFSDFRFQKQTSWFKNALYGFILIKCLYWLFFYSLLFGKHSVIYTHGSISAGCLKSLAFLLYNRSSAYLPLGAILLVVLLCSVNLLRQKSYFVTDTLIFLCMINLHFNVYSTLSSGDYLLNQYIFFNCLLSANHAVEPNAYNHLKRFGHNLAVWALLLQLCVAYLLAGMAKLFDTDWQHGNAIPLILRIHHFSLYSGNPTGGQASWLMLLINYLVLLYQVLFPVLVWFNKIKKPLLWFGIAMHVYIALVMGLPYFSLTMIIGYLLFWPFKKAES